MPQRLLLAVTNSGLRVPEANLLLLWCRAREALSPLAVMAVCQWVLFTGSMHSNGPGREE